MTIFDDPSAAAGALSGPYPIDGLVVLSTDIGYDPDDFVALILAALVVPRGQLVVVTADEVGGLRAQLACRVLHWVGRDDVLVIEGIDLGGHRRLLAEPGRQIPPYLRPPAHEREKFHTRLTEALIDLIAAADPLVYWVGCGPMAELAALVVAAPEHTEKLVVTQMGGWLTTFRDPTRASHNFHTCINSAGLALRVLECPTLVMSEHTNHPSIRVTENWPLITKLEAVAAPQWARSLAAHFRLWFATEGGSWMHDPLTLSAALGMPFVGFTAENIRIGEDARLYRDPRGRAMQISAEVDYDGFLWWMHGLVTW